MELFMPKGQQLQKQAREETGSQPAPVAGTQGPWGDRTKDNVGSLFSFSVFPLIRMYYYVLIVEKKYLAI